LPPARTRPRWRGRLDLARKRRQEGAHHPHRERRGEVTFTTTGAVRVSISPTADIMP
jgi:hypothetical protein